MFERLRILVRNREHWVVEAGRVKNRITRWVDIRFPEYHTVFPNLFGPRSLATLRLFPVPADLTGLSIDQVMQAWGTRLTRPGGDRGRRKAPPSSSRPVPVSGSPGDWRKTAGS